MNQRAPAAIVVSARLGTPVRRPLRRGQDVVGPGAARHVSVAPVDVEDLGEGISVGFTTGAVQPGEDGGVGADFSHGSPRREGLPLGWSNRAHPEVSPGAFAIC